MHFDSPAASSRRLGEEFAPPRAIYVIHIPAILGVTALAAWIASNEMGMVIAAMVASVAAVYMLWDWLLREGPTRFSTLFAITLLLGYGLGAVNTWFTLPRGGLSLAQFLGNDEGVLARGMAGVLLSAVPLCSLGELYERPLFGKEFRLPLDQRTYGFIVLTTLATASGFLTHQLGFMGVQGTFGEQQSVAAALLSFLFSPLTALTIAIFVVTKERFAKLLTGGCMFILCALLLVVGRRVILYTVMESWFALRLTGYRLKGSFFKRALLLSILGLFVAFGVTVFMLVRLAGFQNATNSNMSIPDRLHIVVGWVQDGTALTRAIEANATNAQRRTFVLGFFADILEGSSQNTPGLGRDLAGSTSLAIPRVLNPDKDLNFSEEQLVDFLFGLTYKDAANSILTAGGTDFGLLGAIAYPLLVVLLMRVSIQVFSIFLEPFPISIIALGTIFTLLQTEYTATGYLVTIRNEIIFAIILFLYTRLPKFGLSRR